MFPFFPLVHEYVPRHSLERFHFRGACGMIPPRAKGRSSSRFLVFLGALSIVYSQSTKKSILGIDIDIYIYIDIDIDIDINIDIFLQLVYSYIAKDVFEVSNLLNQGLPSR
jgi:hypothetical protein